MVRKKGRGRGKPAWQKVTVLSAKCDDLKQNS